MRNEIDVWKNSSSFVRTKLNIIKRDFIRINGEKAGWVDYRQTIDGFVMKHNGATSNECDGEYQNS